MSGNGAMLWCRRCEREVPADGPYCPVHPGEELVSATAKVGQVTDDQGGGDSDLPRPVCWKCGTRSTNATSTDCSRCHESLVPPALVIDFPDGSVVVRAPGTSVELGRAGIFGHVFARYPNVSRWHATVSVDANGNAWLTPNPAAPNGTFINDSEIVVGTVVRPGDQIRFAAGRGPNLGPVSERVSQPRRESSTRHDDNLPAANQA